MARHAYASGSIQQLAPLAAEVPTSPDAQVQKPAKSRALMYWEGG